MCIIYIHINDRIYMVDVILSFVWAITNLIKVIYLIYSYRNLTLKVI